MTSASPTETFSILTVCTGNICRSPAAERLLAAALGPSVVVSSAGSYALVAQPISEPMVLLIQAEGADAEGFAARRLSESIIRSADLVLAMTREHRSAAVQLSPSAVRRSFTLLEFARLLQEVNPDDLPDETPAMRLKAAIPLVAAQRRHTGRWPDVDDIADPFRLGDEAYSITFQQIRSAVRSITEIIAPVKVREIAQ